MELSHALYRYCDSPNNDRTCFDLALCYEQQSQLASAFGFYLRAAQHSQHNQLIYESLLRAAFCFEQQGSRPASTKHLFEYAISACPNRPEAYFHICRFMEWINDWPQISLFSSMGLAQCDQPLMPPITDLRYPGTYALKFYRGLSLYHLGDNETATKLFVELNNDKTVDEFYAKLVTNNLTYMSTLRAKNYPKR